MHGYGEIRRKNFRVLRRFHENAVKFTRCTDVNVLAFPQFWTDSRDFLYVRARINSTKLILCTDMAKSAEKNSVYLGGFTKMQ